MRGQDDEEYKRLMELIEEGRNFKNVDENHAFANFKSAWKNLNFLNTRGDNLVIMVTS